MHIRTAFGLTGAAILSILSSAVNASPRPFPLPFPLPLTFTVPAPAPAADDLSGLAALDAVRLKYASSALLSPRADAATVNSTVPANPTQYDTEYTTAIQAGTPAKSYTIVLDTGSASVTLSNAPALGSAGSTVSTTVTVGRVTVTRQAVTIAQPSSQFGSSASDNGSVGLAYTSGSFYVNAVAQGVISPVFTANLKAGAQGTFGFGFVDSTLYKGNISYSNVDTKSAQGFWAVNTTGYAVGKGAFVSASVNPVVVDTGTSLLYLPSSVVTAYYKQVSGAAYDSSQGGYTFPCTATLPDFALGITGGYMATVPGSYINFAPTGSGSKCFGGLQESDDIGISIAGLVLIKSQFVVFKGTSGAPSIGFAKKA